MRGGFGASAAGAVSVAAVRVAAVRVAAVRVAAVRGRRGVRAVGEATSAAAAGVSVGAVGDVGRVRCVRRARGAGAAGAVGSAAALTVGRRVRGVAGSGADPLAPLGFGSASVVTAAAAAPAPRRTGVRRGRGAASAGVFSVVVTGSFSPHSPSCGQRVRTCPEPGVHSPGWCVGRHPGALWRSTDDTGSAAPAEGPDMTGTPRIAAAAGLAIGAAVAGLLGAAFPVAGHVPARRPATSHRSGG